MDAKTIHGSKAVLGVNSRAISRPFAIHTRDAGDSWLAGRSLRQGSLGER